MKDKKIETYMLKNLILFLSGFFSHGINLDPQLFAEKK